MPTLTDFWRRLTEAPATVVDLDRRRGIRLLSGLMLVLIPLGLLTNFIELFLSLESWSTFTAISVALLMLLGVYGLARAGHFTIAALIAVGVTLVAGFGIVLLNPDDAMDYAFLYINIFLAGLLFSEAGVWMSGLVTLLGVAVLLPAMGIPPPQNDPFVVPMFLIIASALLLVHIRHRNAVERDRQAELAAGEARFRILFHSSPVVMGLSRLKDGRLRDVNRAFEEWSGWDRAELIGHTTLDRGFWPSAEERDRVLRPLLREGSTRNVDLRARIRSGEFRDVLVSFEQLQMEGEDYTLATLVDITKRKRDEQETRRLNRLLGTLGAINPVLVSAGSETHLFAGICRTLVEQGEFSMAWIGIAEAATPHVKVACQSGFRHGYLENLDIRYDDTPQGQGPTGTAIRSGQTVINDDTETNKRFAPWRARAREHGYRSTAAIPLRVYGQVVGSLNVYAAVPHAFGSDEVLLLEKLAGDIGMATERLRAMAQIETSERELATILQNMQDTYYRTDLDGRIVRASAAATKLLGYTPEEMEGHRLADFYVDPRGRAQFLATLSAAGGVLQNYEAELRHRDGSMIWVSTNAQYVRDAGGEVIGVEGTVRNISERKQAEQALRASESRYRTIVETAQEGIWQIDADSRTVFVNQKMAELLGYTVAEMNGRTLFDFMDDEGREIAAQNLERRKQGIAEQHEFKFRRQDGSEVWTELTTTPLLDPAGDYTGALAMVTDITKRRLADQALRASEARYRSTLEATAEGIIVQDASGQILSCNPAAERILGLSRDQIMRRTSLDPRWHAVHEDGSPFSGDSHPSMLTLRSGKPESNVIMGVHKPDGSLSWISINSQPLLGPGESRPHGVVTSFHDVTALRAATTALRASESLMAHSQEVARLGSFDWEPSSNTVVWSRQAYRLFGEDPDRPSGDAWSILAQRIHPDDQPRLQAATKRMLEIGESDAMELRVVWSDGSVHVLWMEGVAQRDAKGHPVRVTGVMQDITERKRAEDSLLEIARGVSTTTGESFFRSLVEHLARALHADYALVGALIPDRPGAIRVIALLADGQQMNGFEYVLAGTPCRNVVGRETCVYPHDVQTQFPDDRMLANMGAHAYVGTPLFGADGAALGLVAVLYRRPIPQDAAIGSALEIFASRAAAELERLSAERARHASEGLLRTVVNHAPVVLFTLDRDGVFTLSEGSGLATLGLRPGDAVGQSAFDMYREVPDLIATLRRALSGESFTVQVEVSGRIFETRYTPLIVDGHLEGTTGLALDITERKASEVALRDSEERARTLLDATSEGIFLSEQGRIVEVNQRGAEILRASPEELIGRSLLDFVHPGSRAKVSRQIQSSSEQHYESIGLRNDGTPFVAGISARQITYRGRKVRVTVIRDITHQRETEAEMRKLSSAVEQTADTVMITSREGVIEYVNPAYEHTTGYARAEVIGRNPRIVKSGKQGASFYEKVWKTILAGEIFNDVFINRRKDGSLYYEEKTITPLKNTDGQITHFVSTGKDVTERIQTQERLQHMAQHDALTELPNRALLLDRLKQSMARARWHQRLVAILFVDLDRFKTINDTLGHDVGDRLLQQLAERFGRCVREGDTVARFGGDEFVILLDDVASEQDVSGVAQKALDVLAAPFTVDNQLLYITASIGVSLFPNDGEDSGTLLKNADIAMYRAKELGKNTYQFYSSDMSARAFERLSLETSLRNALERREFVLHYQPQIDSDTGQIVGVEALIRWRHPEFGLVPPADFIPLLEETGLIVPAGEWVLDTACKQLHAWHEAGWPDLRLAVNLSPRQFHTAGLEATIERSLDCIGRDPGLLELEITEGVILSHTRESLDTLAALRALGVRLAIDDFGTGYSSLSYLRRFPIDTLKIDRSFVQDIPGDPDDSAITTTIIVLAQNLKLDVIAEGVENEAQRDFLRRQGCRLMQGYLFSRPLPAEEITRVLEQQKAGRGASGG